jgi:hypothetical protein
VFLRSFGYAWRCCWSRITTDLWEAIPEFDGTKTFDDFKSTIFKLYPNSESKRKWTIADMDKLVGEQLQMGILDVSDLGNYY